MPGVRWWLCFLLASLPEGEPAWRWRAARAQFSGLGSKMWISFLEVSVLKFCSIPSLGELLRGREAVSVLPKPAACSLCEGLSPSGPGQAVSSFGLRFWPCSLGGESRDGAGKTTPHRWISIGRTVLSEQLELCLQPVVFILICFTVRLLSHMVVLLHFTAFTTG